MPSSSISLRREKRKRCNPASSPCVHQSVIAKTRTFPAASSFSERRPRTIGLFPKPHLRSAWGVHAVQKPNMRIQSTIHHGANCAKARKARGSQKNANASQGADQTEALPLGPTLCAYLQENPKRNFPALRLPKRSSKTKAISCCRSEQGITPL